MSTCYLPFFHICLHKKVNKKENLIKFNEKIKRLIDDIDNIDKENFEQKTKKKKNYLSCKQCHKIQGKWDNWSWFELIKSIQYSTLIRHVYNMLVLKLL